MAPSIEMKPRGALARFDPGFCFFLATVFSTSAADHLKSSPLLASHSIESCLRRPGGNAPWTRKPTAKSKSTLAGRHLLRPRAARAEPKGLLTVPGQGPGASALATCARSAASGGCGLGSPPLTSPPPEPPVALPKVARRRRRSRRRRVARQAPQGRVSSTLPIPHSAPAGHRRGQACPIPTNGNSIV